MAGVDYSGIDEFTANVITGGVVLTYKNVTNSDSPYTALTTDSIMLADTSSGAITINLPSAATLPAGKFFYIKNTIDASSNNLTISPFSGNKIDGSSDDITISLDYTAYTFFTDGSTNWYIF